MLHLLVMSLIQVPARLQCSGKFGHGTVNPLLCAITEHADSAEPCSMQHGESSVQPFQHVHEQTSGWGRHTVVAGGFRVENTGFNMFSWGVSDVERREQRGHLEGTGALAGLSCPLKASSGASLYCRSLVPLA